MGASQEDPKGKSPAGQNQTALVPTFGRGILLAAGALNFGFGLGLPISLSVMFLDWQESFSTTRAVTATVHSTCVGILFGGGVLAGYVINRFGARVTFVLGSFLATLGMFLGAFVTNIPLLLISVGIVAGCGFCLIQLPCIPCCTRPFKTNQGVAIAVVTTGGGCISVVLPYFYDFLVDTYSWRGAFIIISGMSLNTLVLELVMTSYVSKNILVSSPETEALVPDTSGATPCGTLNAHKDTEIPLVYKTIDDKQMGETVFAKEGSLGVVKSKRIDLKEENVNGGNFASDVLYLQVDVKDTEALQSENNIDVDTRHDTRHIPQVECDLSQSRSLDLQRSEPSDSMIRRNGEAQGDVKNVIESRKLIVDIHGGSKPSTQSNSASAQNEKVKSCKYADENDDALVPGIVYLDSSASDLKLAQSSLSVSNAKQSPWRFLLDPLAWSIFAFLGLVLGVQFSTQMLAMDIADTKGFPEQGLLLVLVGILSGLVGKAMSGVFGLCRSLSSFMVLAASGVIGSGALAMMGCVSGLTETVVSMSVIGLSLGFIVSVFPKCFLDLRSMDQASYPLALGMGNTVEGVFDFLIPILVGHMVDVSGSYALPYSILSGISLICSCVLMAVYLLTKRKTKE